MEHVLIGLRDWLTAFDGLTIYGVCFGVLLLCGFGLPVPEDITLLICGYLTYRPMPDGTPRPHVHIIASLLIGLAGVLIGDSTMFLAGWPLWRTVARRAAVFVHPGPRPLGAHGGIPPEPWAQGAVFSAVYPRASGSSDRSRSARR